MTTIIHPPLIEGIDYVYGGEQQRVKDDPLPLYTDLVTKSTVGVERGQNVAEVIAEKRRCWVEKQKEAIR